MRSKTIRTVGATVILMGIAIAALAQMGDPSGEPSGISLSPTTTTIETSPPSEPSSHDPEPFVYRMGLLSGVSTDNFWAFYGDEPSVWNSYVLGPTKPALFRIDPTDGELAPELADGAATPRETDSGWSVTVELRRSLSWSDGTPVTAADVAFTFDTVRSLDLRGSWADAFPPMVESVQAEAEHTVRVVFSERPTLSVWPHAVGTAPIMPAHVWKGLAASSDAAGLYAAPGGIDVSGGPLAVEAVSPDHIRSVVNPGYALETAPDVVDYLVYESEAEAVAALESGEIDTVLSPKGLSRDHAARLRDDRDVSIEVSPVNGIRYLGFNLDRAPMSNPAFRTALALMLDREELASEVAGGADVPDSLVGSASKLWHDSPAAPEEAARHPGEPGQRLAEAVSLLAESGYTWETPPNLQQPGTGLRIDGLEPPPLTILTSGDAYDPDRPEYADQIAEVLGTLGFDARTVTTDFDTVVDLTFSRDDEGRLQYDMYLLGWTLGNPSLPDHYRPLFASDGVKNNTGYSSSRYDQALAAYEEAYTYDEAREALWAMETLLADDLPYLLLYASQITEAHRSDRVTFSMEGAVGGLQGRLGGISDVTPVD